MVSHCTCLLNPLLHLNGWPARSSIARVERAHSYRARSASRRTTRLPVPSFGGRALREHRRSSASIPLFCSRSTGPASQQCTAITAGAFVNDVGYGVFHFISAITLAIVTWSSSNPPCVVLFDSL